MGSLSNLYISQSYQSLIHIGTNNTASTTFTELQDGLGNSLGVSVNTLGEISASGNIYGANITGSQVNTGSLVTTSSFNSYTSSTNGRLSSIEATTASLITSSSNALYTASFDNSTRNLTFTKGDSTTFGVVIPDVSGSTINTGSFATTGSNSFTGNQNIDAGFYLATNEIFARTQNLTINGQGSVIITNFMSKPTIIQTNTEITGALNLTGNLTASLQQGYAWVGNASNVSALVPTSSFGGALPAGTISSSAQITGLGFVSSSVTASSLITASFSGNTLTFTKGDSSTFGVIIPDISGSTIPAGTISGSSQITALGFVSSSITASSLVTASVSLNTITFTKGDASTFNIIVNTGSAITTDITALNSFTQSQETKDTTLASVTSSLNSATASLFTSASLALVTASVNLNTITFTKGDTSTFAITVNTGSGGGTLPSGLLSSSVTNFIDYSASVDSRLNAAGGAPQVQDEGSILGNATSFNFNGAGVTATLSAGTASITIPGGGGGSIDTGSFLTTGSATTTQTGNGHYNFNVQPSNDGVAIRLFNTGSDASGSMTLGVTDPGNPFIQLKNRTWFQIQGSDDLNYVAFTASFDNGISVGPNFGSRTQMLTTSGSLCLFNPTPARASVMFHLSASQAARNGVNLVFADNSRTGTTIISGSDNIFTNPNTPTTNYIRYVGGSNNLYLNSSNGVGTQITASAISVSGVRPTMNNNIFNGTNNFAINQAVNGGTHTYSSNYDNGTTTINAMAFTGSLTLSNNINNNGTFTITPASASVAEIASGLSGSHTITMQGNGLFGGSMTINTNRIQPPSVTHTISNNILTGVTLSITNVSSSVGVSVQNNISNGTITYSNAGAANLAVHRSAPNINTNIGALSLIASASAINASNNMCSTALVVTNRSYSGSLGSGSISFNNNQVQGASNTYQVSGSYNGTGAGATMIQNAVFGTSNTFFTNVEGRGNYVHFAANGIFGANLILTGSNNTVLTEQGGAHIGRYNANDGIRNTTGENIFSVGTGTSTTRKTGFLIDSGSNTYVEGTFNVSGSTSLTGSLTIQSGSSFFANGNKQFNVGAFQSNVSQSGSAAVSQSMNFETTDISNGVSMVSNSRITLANSGTYNIQFSAQVLADTGADTVWIWLKKNGTNVSSTTTKLLLRNNEAAVAAWNFVVEAAASDYFELAWESANGDTVLLTEAAGGNYPAIPSIILTVTQVR
jgi:hypothetical protein